MAAARPDRRGARRWMVRLHHAPRALCSTGRAGHLLALRRRRLTSLVAPPGRPRRSGPRHRLDGRPGRIAPAHHPVVTMDDAVSLECADWRLDPRTVAVVARARRARD